MNQKFITMPQNLSFTINAKVQATCVLPIACFVLEVGFWRNHSPAGFLLNASNAGLFTINMLIFAACTSSVCLLNMSVECLFSFQLWGYFFCYAQSESIVYKNLWKRFGACHNF